MAVHVHGSRGPPRHRHGQGTPVWQGMRHRGDEGTGGEGRGGLGVHPEDPSPPRSCTLRPVSWGLPSSQALDLRPSRDKLLCSLMPPGHRPLCAHVWGPASLCDPQHPQSARGSHLFPWPLPRGSWHLGLRGREATFLTLESARIGLTAPGSLGSKRLKAWACSPFKMKAVARRCQVPF